MLRENSDLLNYWGRNFSSSYKAEMAVELFALRGIGAFRDGTMVHYSRHCNQAECHRIIDKVDSM